jgi:two-component sensor histidine kinase
LNNGVGFPEEIIYKNTDSLGMQLFNSLINQIDGQIELDKTNGTGFSSTYAKKKFFIKTLKIKITPKIPFFTHF